MLLADALEFRGQRGEKLLTNTIMRYRIVLRVKLDHVLPPSLPGLVVNDPSREVCPVVVVDVVPLDPVQEPICFNHRVPGQISVILRK